MREIDQLVGWSGPSQTPSPRLDIGPYAAAALAELCSDGTIQILVELHADGLLAEPAPRRYRMHNLIRQPYCCSHGARPAITERDPLAAQVPLGARPP